MKKKKKTYFFPDLKKMQKDHKSSHYNLYSFLFHFDIFWWNIDKNVLFTNNILFQWVANVGTTRIKQLRTWEPNLRFVMNDSVLHHQKYLTQKNNSFTNRILLLSHECVKIIMPIMWRFSVNNESKCDIICDNFQWIIYILISWEDFQWIMI